MKKQHVKKVSIFILLLFFMLVLTACGNPTIKDTPTPPTQQEDGNQNPPGGGDGDTNQDPDPVNPDTGLSQDINGYYYYDNSDYEANSYYYNAFGKEGAELETTLRTIIRNYNKVTYGDARYILTYSDRITVEEGEDYVLGIYDNTVISTTWISSGAGSWQREHVWPQSKLDSSSNNSSKNSASDMHNLRAISGNGINQSRSNRYYVEGTGTAKTVGAEGFYPGDEHKGDVARIFFYMVIMYDFLKLADTHEEILQPFYMGQLTTLLKWHKEDPVSDFELNRNEFIYSGIAKNPNGNDISPQANRNPFIDNPEYAHLIFEGKTIEDITRPAKQETKANINIIDLVLINQVAILNKSFINI